MKAFNTMRIKGLALCALGFVLLTVPLFTTESAILAAYAKALRPAGWFAFAAGVVLVALHHIRNAKRRAQQATLPQQPTATATTVGTDAAPAATPAPGATRTLGDIRAEIQRKQREEQEREQAEREQKARAHNDASA